MSREQESFDNFFREIISGNINKLLDEFQIINFGHQVAALPLNTPKSVYNGFLGSMAAYTLNYKSIDRTVKRYESEWNFLRENASQKRLLLDEIFALVWKEIDDIIKWVESIDNKPDRFGLVAASAALIRLQSSFRTANLLIRLGYIFEASALCRLILEQISWAFCVHDISDEKVFKVSPPKSITRLRDFLPDVGNTYGFLNRFTHIDPHLINQYLVAKNSTSIAVSLNSPEATLPWAWLMLVLVDYYTIVYEYIFRDYAAMPSRIEKDITGSYSPKDTRRILSAVVDYRKKLKDLEQTYRSTSPSREDDKQE